jgi:predicted N-acetyltransferase YhbS
VFCPYHLAVSLPGISNLAVRPATPSDVEAITDLVAACEVAADGVAEVDRTDVEQALRVAGERDTIVAAAPDRLAGWATLAGDRATVDVHPAWHGRGVGAALRAWTEARARASGLGRIRQVVTDGDKRAHRSFEAAGYRPAYTAWILQMALEDEPPRVVIPPGIVIREYRPGDATATYRVIEDAFNEWPGRRPTDFEGWSAHITSHTAFAPHLSRLAFDGDELVGAALSDDYGGPGEGWVQQLATRATHRHRGIARALLQSVFAAFHATGRRQVGLSTNSTTGALTLYRRLGMTVRRSYTGWARELEADGVAPGQRQSG